MEGDVLKYFNWTDVSVTGELILNITKHLTLESNKSHFDSRFPPLILKPYLSRESIKIYSRNYPLHDKN